MLGEGHAHAAHYPLAYLWNEVAYSDRRRRNKLRSEMSLFYAAVGTAMNGGDVFKNAMEKLDGA